MSLAASVLRIVERALAREGGTRVRRVVLEIGALAPVDRQALAFALEVASRGTLAEQASFELELVPGIGRCARCGRDWPMSEGIETCAACDGAPLKVTAGTGMQVRELEIE